MNPSRRRRPSGPELRDVGLPLRPPRKTLAREEAHRLLINPCLDDPAEHLSFSDDGLVLPRPSANDTPSRKGETSITVYALQRKVLVEERLRVLNRLVLQIEQVRVTIAKYSALKGAGDAAGVERNRQQIVALKRDIRGPLASDAPYLGMLRDWIRRHKNAGGLADLERFKIDLENLG
jgi:hypothetical protein